MGCIGLKHVALIDGQISDTNFDFIWSQIYYLFSNFQRPKLFEDDFSVIFDSFSSTKCLSITTNLANDKLLVDGKHLVVVNLQQMVNFQQILNISINQNETDLTYLLDLTIDDNLACLDL